MRIVTVSALESRLGDYVRLVASGETVLVADQHKVVAELRPPPGRSVAAADARLAEVIRTGWLSVPLVVGEGPPPSAPVAPLSELMRELDEGRKDP